MKYHGRMNIGSNSAGKGDKNRAFMVDKKRSKEAIRQKNVNFDKIFNKRKIEKQICKKCGKLKVPVRTVYKANGNIEHYCSSCR